MGKVSFISVLLSRFGRKVSAKTPCQSYLHKDPAAPPAQRNQRSDLVNHTPCTRLLLLHKFRKSPRSGRGECRSQADLPNRQRWDSRDRRPATRIGRTTAKMTPPASMPEATQKLRCLR